MELDVITVFDFINNKLENNENVTVKDCCEEFNYSYYYFSRLFKSLVGLPPSRYITALKMEKSLDLLLDPEMNVSEVYNKVQYQSPSSFARSFKKYMGISPKKYKQEVCKLSEVMESFLKTEERIELTFYSKLQQQKSEQYDNFLDIGIELPEGVEVPMIVLGLYNEPIALGKPIRGKALFNISECKLENIQEGKYYLCVSIVDECENKEDYFTPNKLLKKCIKIPVDIPKENNIIVNKKNKKKFDMPVVINLPKLILDELKDDKVRQL